MNWGHTAVSFQGAGAIIQNNKINNNYFTFENIIYGRAIGLNSDNTKYNEVYNNYIYKQRVPSHTV